MSIIDLTQQEADALIAMDKVRISDERYLFPQLGGSLRIPLKSKDAREEFMLDITRGQINLKKNTFQNRARKAIVLVRVDIDGPPHCNPDDKIVDCPHIHTYREGFGDKWAVSLPDFFSKPDDSWTTLEEFMKYCNISDKPNITRELFI